MGRYTRGDDSWEITRDGLTITIVENGVSTVETMPSTKLAETRERVLINQRARDGWKLYKAPAPTVEPYVAPPPTTIVYDATNPDLEAAILEDPDNLSLYEVYGDWLQGQGDPRGKLIALEVATRGKPYGDKHHAAQNRYYDEHRAYFERGLPKVHGCNVLFRLGFPWRIEMLTGRFSAMLATALPLPAFRFLTGIWLDAEPHPHDPDGVASDLADALAIIAKHASPALRSLSIGGATTLSDLAMLAPRLPALREFAIANVADRELEVDAKVVRTLIASPLPRLEHLTLELLRGNCAASDLEPLFSRDLPALTTLAVRTPFDADIVRALVGSRVGRRLVRLELGTPEAATEVANLLLSRRTGLPALRTISLPLAGLAAPVREALGAAFEVTDDDGIDRYEHGVE